MSVAGSINTVDVAASLCCTTDAWDCAPQARMPWLRLVIGLFVAAQTMSLGMAISITRPDDAGTLLLLQLGMFAATALVVALLGLPLAVDALRALVRGRLTMELLFTLGVGAALAVSVRSMLVGAGSVYFDVVCVLVIVYSAGRAINVHSRRRALASARTLTRDIDVARRCAIGGGQELVGVASIAVGDCVRVLPGEWIPVDGRVIEGASLVRQTPFSGEWVSALRRPGDDVLAGTAAEDGSLLIQATAPGVDRRVDRLAALIDSARRSPTSLQRQADRLVRWFLPVVLTLCAGTFVYWTIRADWERGLFNALAVLLIACPCAAGLATPLALWSTLGYLARRGLIVRAGDTIERLAAVDGAIFDKTGTLGDQRLALQSIATDEDPDRRAAALSILRAVEGHSNHPVARVLCAVALDEPGVPVHVASVRVLPGQGIEADVRLHGPDGVPRAVRIVRAGVGADDGVLRLTMTVDGAWAAGIALTEHLRDSADRCVSALARMNLPVRVMTGDGPGGARRAAHLGQITAAMTPEQKYDAVLALRQAPDGPARPLFVGDGINDAAAMAGAHASIALADGAAVTVDTASATLHGGDLMAIPHAIALSRRAVSVIRSNLRWAVLYNFAGILAAAGGYLHPVIAAVLMGASSALVGWRSFRIIPAAADDGAAPTDTDAAWRAVEAAPRQPIAPPVALPSREPSSRRRRWFVAAHAVGFIGQGAILALLAGLGAAGWILTLGAFALIALAGVRLARRLPPFADMIMGMLSLGGLGMNLGWWADGGFASAIRDGAAHSCCAAMLQASVSHESHWMYWGMLLAGVPAMYLLRWRIERFSFRRWCCVGPIVIGIPAMALGMFAGAVLATDLTRLGPSSQVLASYVLMMLGMTAGMLLPHLGELLGQGIRT